MNWTVTSKLLTLETRPLWFATRSIFCCLSIGVPLSGLILYFYQTDFSGTICSIAALGSNSPRNAPNCKCIMNRNSKKSPVYSGGHQAWGRIFWGFVILVLLSFVVSI